MPKNKAVAKCPHSLNEQTHSHRERDRDTKEGVKIVNRRKHMKSQSSCSLVRSPFSFIFWIPSGIQSLLWAHTKHKNLRASKKYDYLKNRLKKRRARLSDERTCPYTCMLNCNFCIECYCLLGYDINMVSDREHCSFFALDIVYGVNLCFFPFVMFRLRFVGRLVVRSIFPAPNVLASNFSSVSLHISFALLCCIRVLLFHFLLFPF